MFKFSFQPETESFSPFASKAKAILFLNFIQDFF